MQTEATLSIRGGHGRAGELIFQRKQKKCLVCVSMIRITGS